MDKHLVITYVITSFIWIYQQVALWVQMVDKSLFPNFFEENVKYPHIDTDMVDELSEQVNDMLDDIKGDLNDDKLKNMRCCVKFIENFVMFIKNMNKFSKMNDQIDFQKISDKLNNITAKIAFIDLFPSHFNLKKEYMPEFFSICDYFRNFIHNNVLNSSVLATSNILPKNSILKYTENSIFETNSNIVRQKKGKPINPLSVQIRPPIIKIHQP